MAGTEKPSEFEYDVAFSFLSQDCSLAEQIADRLSPTQKVFIFPRRQEQIAGSDGMTTMTRIFARDARVVAVLYRPKWGTTPWTRVEKDAIFDRGLEKGWNFCLFVALDAAKPVPDEIPNRRIYYDLTAYGLDGVAGAIKMRIAEMDGEARPESPEVHAIRVSKAMEFAAAQDQFRNSTGVRLAVPEFDRLRKTVADVCKRQCLLL